MLLIVCCKGTALFRDVQEIDATFCFDVAISSFILAYVIDFLYFCGVLLIVTTQYTISVFSNDCYEKHNNKTRCRD